MLTDILGDEDALGDMDFKIAGTAEGVTGVQMDIKITGLTTEIMRAAMQQAHEGRHHILEEMAKAIAEPRKELSRFAPQHAEVFVNPDIIRLIIGPGGKNIKAITAALGEPDDAADICTDTKGNPEPDPSLRDTENVPWDQDIDDYLTREVLPYAPDAWIDHTKTREGAEIPFTRHFYKYIPPRPLEDIDRDLEAVMNDLRTMLQEVER